jgi:lipoyl-dependent peroxiredoxin
LRLKAKVSDIDEDEFQRIARNAEQTCPVSNAFSFDIRLQAVLVQ